jgi:hypothetical protein
VRRWFKTTGKCAWMTQLVNGLRTLASVCVCVCVCLDEPTCKRFKNIDKCADGLRILGSVLG